MKGTISFQNMKEKRIKKLKDLKLPLDWMLGGKQKPQTL